MKKRFNAIIDWFEEHFNSIIDMTALLGAIFMILFSFILFVMLMIDSTALADAIEIILPPGAIGFFGILMLFALRITRHITKEHSNKEKN